MHRSVDPVPAMKQELARELLSASEGWSQSWAAWAIHTSRSRVSELRRGKLENVSLELLVRGLSQLGYRVDITLTREPRKPVRPS
jgi:predicted XRE-type DNA-binding protein